MTTRPGWRDSFSHLVALSRGVHGLIGLNSILVLVQRLALPAAALVAQPGELTAVGLIGLAFLLSRARRAIGFRTTIALTPALLSCAARRVLGRRRDTTAEVQEERALAAVAMYGRFFTTTGPLIVGDLLALPIVVVLALQLLGPAMIPVGLGAALTLAFVIASWRTLRPRWIAVETEISVTAAWLAAAVRGGDELRTREIQAHYFANLSAHGEAWARRDVAYERSAELVKLTGILLGGALAIAGLAAMGHPPDELVRIATGRSGAGALRGALLVGATLPIVSGLPHAVLETFELRRFAVYVEPAPDADAGAAGGKRWPAGVATLSLHAASVRYDQHVGLDRATVELPLGGVTAIVGANGAGKSTMARLLTGLVAPFEGSVSVGDIPLHELDPESLAREAVLVPQAPALIESLTLAENVRLVVPGATPEEIVAALARVGLEMPPTTLLGQASRGEQRRVAIARALLRRPSVLVLDEPDAWLDATGRHALASALRDAGAQRTVVLVTHRADLVHWVDRVIVLGRDHRVADVGSPGELAVRCAEFRALLSQDPDESPPGSAT